MLYTLEPVGAPVGVVTVVFIALGFIVISQLKSMFVRTTASKKE
jgi:hypothetical protein